MSKTTFSGMCIGGPNDGKHASHGQPHMNVELPLRLPPWPAIDQQIPTEAVVSRFTYSHVAFHFRNSDRPGWERMRGFWTPHDVHKDDQHLYVLDTLAKAYRERADG